MEDKPFKKRLDEAVDNLAEGDEWEEAGFEDPGIEAEPPPQTGSVRGPGRSPSNITVHVWDLAELEAQALSQAQQNPKMVEQGLVEIRVGHKPWGFVDTPQGAFALCTEGVGSRKPVSVVDPLTLDLYGEYERGGKHFSDMMPVYQMTVTDVHELPVVRKQSLTEFVRTFGGRLDANYREWRKFLEKALRGE